MIKFITLAIFAPGIDLIAQEPAYSAPPGPRRSGVILIVADDIGIRDLGCYGSGKAKTPNLDKLADEGARFTCFYAGSTSDSASRASLVLGMHTGHLHIRDDSRSAALRADDTTFGQLLSAAGYRSGLIGTWGLSDGVSGLPQNKGFEQFAGFLNTSEAGADYPEWINRYEPANALDRAFDGRMQLSDNAQGKSGQHVFKLLTKAAMNFVRIAKPESHNQYRPFFLMLDYPLPRSVMQSESARAETISHLDASIGQLLEKLKEMKMETNTIVMFASNRSPREQGNAKLSETNLRVPFIVRWPAHLKSVAISEPWAAWDIFPTMTEIARTDCPTNIDGISFYPLLRGQTQTNRHDFFYWESHDSKRGSQQAARMGHWKAMRRPGAPIELYDLKSDPTERNDVAAKQPDVIAAFEKRLKSARTEADGWPLRGAIEGSQKTGNQP
jgi:uncharacterized sulfatase